MARGIPRDLTAAAARLGDALAGAARLDGLVQRQALALGGQRAADRVARAANAVGPRERADRARLPRHVAAAAARDQVRGRRGSTGSREEILAVVRALTPTGAAQPTVQASPLTVWVHAPGITDPDVQEALRVLLLLAIPDVADLALDFAGEDVLKFDTIGLGFDQGKLA